MELEPNALKKIIETFKIELEELLQVITDGVIAIEKNQHHNSSELIESIFRAAHTIKGAAQGLGINSVGDIAHHMESLFSCIKKKEMSISPSLIDLCLEAVDAMRSAMLSFTEKTALSFDLPYLIHRLKTGKTEKPIMDKRESVDKQLAKDDAVKKTNTESAEYETIRVSLTNIDRISALMEEVQVNKIAIDDHYAELSKLTVKAKQVSHVWKQTLLALKSRYGNELDDNLEKLYHSNSDYLTELTNSIYQLHQNMRPRINELSVLSNALQDEIHMLRLVPAANLMRTFQRSIRDLAKDLNKQVELIIKGDDVQIDKMVLDGLKDPLIHLLRNAIDHGIESADIRKSCGKTECGHITIDIKDEGNQILFVIHDDGSGLDAKNISKAAEDKNIVSKSELDQMSENNILDLIFRPGFSTRSIITDTSGRGVGLDIVKANLAYLKGSVSVTSELGKGTTFYLRVPLTLSSERGLMINCGGQFFVIPTSGVERVLVINAREIIDVEATQVIMLDKQPIPLRHLANILELADVEPAYPHQLSIVVVKKGSHSVALLVDDIVGEKEIVVKPLHAPLLSIPCVTGGTLSSNGQVIIVLNYGDLINAALTTTTKSRVQVRTKEKAPQTKPHILVVDDSITTRTLEKNILESNHYTVTVAVNGKDAWELLQKQTFSLLITDLTMPIMDGFMLTERVKQSKEMHDLPVIIVTSLGSDAEKKRGIEVGADAYIVKNEFESGSLLEIVAQLV